MHVHVCGHANQELMYVVTPIRSNDCTAVNELSSDCSHIVSVLSLGFLTGAQIVLDSQLFARLSQHQSICEAGRMSQET